MILQNIIHFPKSVSMPNFSWQIHNAITKQQKKRVTFLQLSDFQCGVTGNRTRDTRIFSPLL